MKKQVLSLALAAALVLALAPVSLVPASLAADGPIAVMVSTGYEHTVVIDADGDLWTWGDNYCGQLGDGTSGSTNYKTTPVKIEASAKFTSVSAGYWHTMAIDTNGDLWAWGDNTYGQLGDGTTTSRNKPVRISPPTVFGETRSWKSVSAGQSYTMAIDTNGNLWAWGYNADGQLGNGTRDGDDGISVIAHPTPVRVSSSPYYNVSTGGYHTIAIDAYRHLWVWGRNGHGQLGIGTSEDKDDHSTPVAIMKGVQFTSVSAGAFRTIAIDSNGSLWAWGSEIGLTGLFSRNSPTQILYGAQFTSVSTGPYHTMAIDLDGVLWAWGRNDGGQLGNGTSGSTVYGTPVKIKEGTKFTSVSASGAHGNNTDSYTMAIDADGGLWAWGYNRWGQLGDGTTTRRNTPVRIWPPTDVPGAPQNLIVTPGDTQIDVSWTAPADDGGSAITGYKIQLDNGAVIDKSATDLTHTFDNLINGTSYTIKVWAVNAVGQSATAAHDTVIPTDVIPPVNHAGIDYAGVTDVIVPGSESGFSINLTKETFTTPDTYKVTAYSIDGGTKWIIPRADTFTTKFPNLLNKDMTLQLTDKFNVTTKKPANDANVVTFPKIGKRAAAPKLAVNYLIGATFGDWVLVSKVKGADVTVAVKDGIQIGVANAANKNKTVDAKGFGQFYAGLTNGIPVKPLTGAKVEKTVYFVRTAPQPADATGAYTAASKPVKVTATGENKAPSYKLDYKKESVKLKKGDLYSTDGGESFTEVTEAKGIVLDVSACITSGTAVVIKKAATAKKPASAAQTIAPAPRAELTTNGVATANGKLTLDKKYEVYNATANKWGGAPKVTASGEFDIRLKPTAKVAATGTTGSAASVPGKLKVTYGEYAPGKNGVVSAEIVP